MLSSTPALVAVLAVTGTLAALARAWAWARSRGPGVAQPVADPVLSRLRALTDLAWTVFFLVHFVLLAILAESREVGETLSVVGSVASGLTLCAALVSLVAVLRRGP